jgi:hypothetical protein
MATIDYTAGNIDVTFFPTNTGAVRFCDKSVGGVNIATNNDTLAANTIKIGNSSTTTALAGAVTASGTVTLAGTVSVSGALTAPTPASDSIGTQVTTAAWVRTFITSFLETIQTFTLGIRISTIYGKATESAFALWSEIAASSITIGNGSTITLSGTTIANTVSSRGVGTTLALGGNITTGAVEIGKNQAALGTITIGSSNSKTTMNGNVGIGKTASSYALDVSGTAQFTNSICSNANFGNWYSYYDVNGAGKNYKCLSTNTGGAGLYDFALYQDTGSTTLNSAAKLRFNIGDVEKMTMLTNGNVGIGTITPDYTLDVAGTAKVRGSFEVDYTTSAYNGDTVQDKHTSLTISTGTELSNAILNFRNNNGTGVIKRALISYGSGYSGASSRTNAGLHFCLNTTEDNTTNVSITDSRMMITPSGNVGIGTTTPVYSLDVSGTALVKKALGNTASFGKVGIGSPVTEASLTASYVVASGPTLTNGEYFTTLTVGYGLLTLSIPYSLEANKSATIIITCRSNQSDMYFRVTNLSSGWLYTSSVISTTATTYTFTITNGETASAYLLLYAYSETNTSNTNRQFIYSKFSLYPEPTNTLEVNGTMNVTGYTNIGGFINSGYTFEELKKNGISYNITPYLNPTTSQYSLSISGTTGEHNYGFFHLANYNIIPNKAYRITITCRTNQSDLKFVILNNEYIGLYTSPIVTNTNTTYTFTVTAPNGKYFFI